MAQKKKRPKPEPKPAKDPKSEKQKKSAAIAKAVWKATEASRTTIGKLAALVDTWDEYDQKAENLKDEIGGLKGSISEHKAEMRSAAREAMSKDADTDKLAKKMGSLERDLERWEVKLTNKQEERSGAVEAKKCAMGDIRQIIRDGPGLFDETKTAPRSAEEVGAEVQKTAKSNGTNPPLKSPGSLKPVTVSPPDPLVDVQIDVAFGKSHGIREAAVQALTTSGMNNLSVVRDWFKHYRNNAVRLKDIKGLTSGDVDPIENAIMHHVGNAKRAREAQEAVGAATR